MRAMCLGILVVAVAFHVPSAAAGQETGEVSAEARQRFEIASQAFERGDFATALQEWERVYTLMDGHPRRSFILYNIARSNEELGRNQEALELYQRFLAESSADAPNRDEAQRHASELGLRLELDRERGAEGATRVDAGFVPSPIGIAVASVGAAAVIAGAIAGAVAIAKNGEALTVCIGTRCTPEAHAALGDAGMLANVSDGLLWPGVAVVVAGAILLFALGETSSPTVSAACTDTGCVGIMGGRF